MFSDLILINNYCWCGFQTLLILILVVIHLPSALIGVEKSSSRSHLTVALSLWKLSQEQRKETNLCLKRLGKYKNLMLPIYWYFQAIAKLAL